MQNNLEITEYSSFNPAVVDEIGRTQIANQILTIFQKHGSDDLSKMKVLDLGCSTGVIANLFSKHCLEVVGIDIDSKAIAKAREKYKSKNLKFFTKSATETGLPNDYFDLIICNQVYYWIEKPEKLTDEIYRLLKPRGLCFFGARNKYTLWDAQYYLPLIAVMPKPIADFYVRTTGKAKSYECHYLSFNSLKHLCKKFIVTDYTLKVLKNPITYNFKSLEQYSFFMSVFPVNFLKLLEPLIPNFIWILEKPTD